MMLKSILITIFLSLITAVSFAQKATITSASIENAFIPVVPGRTDNVVSKIKFTATEATTLKEAYLTVSGTFSVQAIQQISIYATGSHDFFTRDSMLFSTVFNPGTKVKLSGALPLHKGDNYLWITAVVKPGVSTTDQFNVVCSQLNFDNGNIIPVNNSTASRIGIALRKHGDDNVHTYRIPGLATTKKGTLIGVYDVRYNNHLDLQEDVNVGMSRSTDGGKTWEPMKIIMDMGNWGGKSRRENGIGDPTVLVDDKTNTIWVAGLWAHGHLDKRTWVASGAGILPEQTGQFMLVKSTDDGITWSKPVNITSQIKNPEWRLLLQGPGKGITMKNGTLVFPAQYIDADNVPHSTIVYSTNGGNYWQIGKGARSHTTEAQVVELNDGSLMLNMRDDRGRDGKTGSRAVAITKNMGATWAEHATNRNTLDEPVCMASIDRFYFKKKNGSFLPLLLFSNPDSKTTRNNITLKVSKDDGMSWPAEYHILLDKGTGPGYTCLTQIDDYNVGILYESSKADLVFQVIDLREVLND